MDTAPHGVQTPTPMADDWLGFVKPAAPGENTVPSADQSLPYTYNSNASGTIAVIPRDETGPHGVETQPPGTPLSAGVREAGGPHPFGARRFSKFIGHDLIDQWSNVK